MGKSVSFIATNPETCLFEDFVFFVSGRKGLTINIKDTSDEINIYKLMDNMGFIN